MTPTIYENGCFWVRKAKHGYEVYENGATHATSRAIIDYEGETGLAKAIAEADRLAARTE